MDAAQALADLTEISSQVVQVAILDGDGAVLASTIARQERAARFAEGLSRLVEEAEAARRSHGLPGLAQLEVATLDGSVFVVRDPDGPRLIAATTLPDPTVGLVFYDLKHCLRSIGPDAPAVEPAPARRRAKKADAGS